jgi:hypothetical protein
MRPLWTPRFRIWALLALIAIMAVLLAFFRPTSRGKLRIAKLRHAGNWNVTPGHSPSLLDIPAKTNLIEGRSLK